MGSVRIILFFSLSLFCFEVDAQNKNFEINGYVSALHTSGYNDAFEEWNNLNKINNRLNLNVWLNNRISFNLEIQNRFYSGSYLSQFNGFSQPLIATTDYFNWSHNWINNNSTVFQSRIDRLFMDFSSGMFSIRVGRQRINWGQTLVWNVNDIFNSYSFFEIDNFEKYGCDAIRMTLFPSPSSVIEATVKINSDEEITAAVMSRFNYNEMDFQIQGGVVDEKDVVIGAGITGDYKGLTIRTECSYYHPLNQNTNDKTTLLLNAGLDYVFSNRMAIQSEVLYNQLNNKDLTELFVVLFAAPVTSKTLSISEWSYALNWVFPVSPRLDLNISTVYFPDYSGYYLSPTIDFKLMKNLDLSGICQVYSLDYLGERNAITSGTVRLKYHF